MSTLLISKFPLPSNTHYTYIKHIQYYGGRSTQDPPLTFYCPADKRNASPQQLHIRLTGVARKFFVANICQYVNFTLHLCRIRIPTRKMNPKNQRTMKRFLLPHAFQTVGWLLLLASLVTLAVAMVLDTPTADSAASQPLTRRSSSEHSSRYSSSPVRANASRTRWSRPCASAPSPR